MVKDPSAKELLGYLFVRGGVHAHAYALGLEQLTGVDMKKMLPIPKIENTMFAEARKYEALGAHRKLYRFRPSAYQDVAKVWQGAALAGSGPLEVVDQWERRGGGKEGGRNGEV